jgi:hypothetical protein
MSTAQTLSSTNRPFTWRTALMMLLGAALGCATGLGIMMLFLRLHVSPRSVGWMDILSLWVGIVYIALSLVSAYLSTNPRQLAKQLEGDLAKLPATRQEVVTARLQACVLFLAGALMVAPSLLETLVSGSPRNTAFAYSAIVVLFAVQTVANLRIWALSDEFMRQAIASVCALTFAIGQGLLFLWAAAEHLHLVHTGSSWSILTAEMLLYIFVSSYVTLRNQMR